MDADLIVGIIADGAVIPVVLLGAWSLVMYVPKGERYGAYGRVLMAGLTAFLIAKLVGFIYQPELVRPFQLLGVEAGASFLDNPGFPSDHMLFTSAITLAVWFETKKKWAAGVLLGLTLATGLGRVLALVHTPLDILGGAAVALVGALWYLQPRFSRANISK